MKGCISEKPAHSVHNFLSLLCPCRAGCFSALCPRGAGFERRQRHAGGGHDDAGCGKGKLLGPFRKRFPFWSSAQLFPHVPPRCLSYLLTCLYRVPASLLSLPLSVAPLVAFPSCRIRLLLLLARLLACSALAPSFAELKHRQPQTQRRKRGISVPLGRSAGAPCCYSPRPPSPLLSLASFFLLSFSTFSVTLSRSLALSSFSPL